MDPKTRRYEPDPAHLSAFTIVELLVVFTVIIVLVALLTPALEKSVYQAELAVCAAQQRAVARLAVDYALDHKRAYPHRRGPLEDASLLWKPNNLYLEDPAYDLRPVLDGYIDLNTYLIDPLNPGKVDLANTHPDSRIEAGYNLWFGWGYLSPPGAGRVMRRIGARFAWDAVPYDVLVSDLNADRRPGADGAGTGHADDLNLMRPVVLQDQTGGGQDPTLPKDVTGNVQWVMTRWDTGGRRGLIDVNITHEDLSVHRYSALEMGDPRMRPVNAFSRGVPAASDHKQYLHR